MGFLRLLPRLVYFAVAPFVLVAAAVVLPMAGLLLNVVLMLAGLAVIEALRGASQRSRVARALLRRHLAFEAFYREHPPRSFAYYVFFPLLFPYWLVNRTARQEVGLYRGVTRVGLVVLAAQAVLGYVRVWAPEISVGKFVASSLGIFVIEFGLLLALVIPLSATIVSCTLRGDRRTVRILLAVAGLSVAVGLLGVTQLRAGMVPADVPMRVEARAHAVPERAAAVLDAALRAVWSDLRRGAARVESDGWIGGATLDRAHAELAGFYRDDEASAFSVYAWPAAAPTHAIVQIHLRPDMPPIWRASDGDGLIVADASAVPPEIFNARPSRPPPLR